MRFADELILPFFWELIKLVLTPGMQEHRNAELAVGTVLHESVFVAAEVAGHLGVLAYPLSGALSEHRWGIRVVMDARCGPDHEFFSANSRSSIYDF